jgi:wobble nucleotide-excising tRNase
VVYEPPRQPKKAQRVYGTVRKRLHQSSIVEFSESNPIQTAYAALWDEVKRARADPHTSVVGLQNVLRRILETYFKVLGDIDTEAIIAEFTGSEQVTCKALFSWVNAGSHSIFDDLHYSQSSVSFDSNLHVFEQIFITQDQHGHYRMMMGQSAEDTVPGSDYVRAAAA